MTIMLTLIAIKWFFFFFVQGTSRSSWRDILTHVRHEPWGSGQRDEITIFERRENYPVILIMLCALSFKITKKKKNSPKY